MKKWTRRSAHLSNHRNVFFTWQQIWNKVVFLISAKKIKCVRFIVSIDQITRRLDYSLINQPTDYHLSLTGHPAFTSEWESGSSLWSVQSLVSQFKPGAEIFHMPEKITWQQRTMWSCFLEIKVTRHHIFYSGQEDGGGLQGPKAWLILEFSFLHIWSLKSCVNVFIHWITKKLKI